MNLSRIIPVELSQLGPLALLLAASIVILKGDPFYFPIIAVAIPCLCASLKWGTKTLIPILGAVFSTFFYLAFSTSLTHIFWLFGITLSAASSLILTALVTDDISLHRNIQTIEEETQKNKIGSLEQSNGSLQSRLTEEQQKLLTTQNERGQFFKEAAETREKLNNCSDQLHKEKKSHEYARSLIKEQQATLSGITSQNEVLSRNKKSLEADMLKLQQDTDRTLKQEKQLLEQQQNVIAQHKGELQRTLQESEKLREDNRTAMNKTDELSGKIELMQSEKEQLSAGIALLNQEKEVLQQKLEAKRSARSVQGKYEQLQEQFNEKSTLLNATRQELFFTQEQLFALQRLWDEHHHYNRDKDQLALDKHLSSLEKEYQNMTQQYTCEVDALHDLVAALLKKK